MLNIRRLVFILLVMHINIYSQAYSQAFYESMERQIFFLLNFKADGTDCHKN